MLGARELQGRSSRGREHRADDRAVPGDREGKDTLPFMSRFDASDGSKDRRLLLGVVVVAQLRHGRRTTLC